MRKIGILLACSAIMFTFSPAFAGDDREAFYVKCIDERIEQCQLKASRSGSRSPCMKVSAEKAAEQVRFYQAHREELVREMQRQQLDAKPAQINHFLIQAYNGRDH